MVIDPLLLPLIHHSDMPPEKRSATLDESVIDESYSVEPEEAYETAREVARTEGILVGESSGAAIFIAKQLALKPENEGKRIVAIAVDTGLRYLSTKLFG